MTPLNTKVHNLLLFAHDLKILGGPGLVAQVFGVSSYIPKGLRFHSQSRQIPKL